MIFMIFLSFSFSFQLLFKSESFFILNIHHKCPINIRCNIQRWLPLYNYMCEMCKKSYPVSLKKIVVKNWYFRCRKQPIRSTESISNEQGIKIDNYWLYYQNIVNWLDTIAVLRFVWQKDAQAIGYPDLNYDVIRCMLW